MRQPPPRSSQAGFSLIELVIVLAIIGSILALILSGISGAKRSADKNETILRAGQLYSQLIRYQSDLGKFPSTQEGLEVLFTSPGGAKWTGPYGSREELGKDKWDNPFTYELTPKGPRITSSGPDGVPGTADDLVFINGTLSEETAPGAASGG